VAAPIACQQAKTDSPTPDQFSDPAAKAVGSTRKDPSKMPKLKTNSSVKKRFKRTGSGKVKATAAGKRHGMIKRTAKFVRDARGTMVLSEPDTKRIRQWMPYERKARKRRVETVAVVAAE
jgi:large subunit ribosomal protein L35